MFEESELLLQRFKKEDLYDGFYKKKIYNYNFFTNFVIKNNGLFPDSDWIRTQKQAESGFIKYLDLFSGLTHRRGISLRGEEGGARWFPGRRWRTPRPQECGPA